MSPLGLRRKKKKDADDAPAAAPAPAPAPAAPRQPVEKPGPNIYTVLLSLSMVAIIIGCICLYAELSAYEFKLN